MSESASSGQPTTRFAVLGIRDYRLLWWSGLFIFLAFQTQQIARGWLAYDITQSNTALGGVIFAFGVTSLIAIPVGGVLADRFNKRSILLFSQSMMAFVTLCVACAIAFDRIEYWMLVAAGAVQGLGISLSVPSRLALTAEIVRREALTNAILLSNASLQITRIIGPAVGGVLISWAFFGVGGVYFLCAAFASGSIFITSQIGMGKPRRQPQSSPFQDLKDGFKYVGTKPELKRLLVISLFVVMFGFPYITFLPSLVANVYQLDSWAFGILAAAAAIGAVATSVGLTSAPQARLPNLQMQAAFVFGGSLVAFALVPQYWVAVAVMVIVGGSSSGFQSLNNSQALTIADVEYHGRVQSLIMLSFSGFGLASLPFGSLADAYGIRPVMTAMGVLVMGAMLIGVFWRTRIARARTSPL